MAVKLVVPASVRAVREAELRLAIPTDQGVDAFGRILACRRNRVIVTSFDLRRAQALAAEMRESAPTVEADPELEAQARPDLSSPYREPVGTSQTKLAGIWTELIGVSGIGVDDDFFALGGHSLLATRVLSRISETMGAHLTVREFFESPTIRGLAAIIDRARDRTGPSRQAELEEDREEFLL